MEFTLTAEQEMLRTSARKFLTTYFPSEYVRKMWELPQGYEQGLWTKMGELGWMGLTIPEVYGGLGLTFRDLGLILQEMGRVVLPGPFFSTVILATELIREAGLKEQKAELFAKIAAGELMATVALYEPDVDWGPEGIQLIAERKGEGYFLQGTKLFVPDAHVADVIIVAARTGKSSAASHGISLFLVDPQADGVTVELLPTMDQGRKLCAVSCAQVAVSSSSLLGVPDQAWPAISKMLARANIALCLEMLGGGERTLEMATDYARVRVQFGQPIGSYQAIKHRCADMLLEVESSRSIVEYAAWTVDANPGETQKAAALAKTYVSEMFRKATAGTIQILGGIGFSWEHDIHLYYKRAFASESSYGDSAFQLEYLASQWAAI